VQNTELKLNLSCRNVSELVADLKSSEKRLEEKEEEIERLRGELITIQEKQNQMNEDLEFYRDENQKVKSALKAEKSRKNSFNHSKENLPDVEKKLMTEISQFKTLVNHQLETFRQDFFKQQQHRQRNPSDSSSNIYNKKKQLYQQQHEQFVCLWEVSST
jgi:chromosome segregation ATPase